MSKLVLWYGLPGSGKSEQLKQLAAARYPTFDDFMERPGFRLPEFIAARRFDRIAGVLLGVHGWPTFASSVNFDGIVKSLHGSSPCGVADVLLCHQAFRDEVKEALVAVFPSLVMEWHCFDSRSEGALEMCEENVRLRSERTGRPAGHALAWIDRYASEFSVEPDAKVHAVVPVRSVI